MLKSMTGFGRCELQEPNRKIIVEIKSVNHRYFDLSIKMPKKFYMFESEIRKVLQEYCTRGKLDLYIAYEDLSADSYQIHYNENLAAQYTKCLTDISTKFGIPNDITSVRLLQYPDVLTIEEQPLDQEELLTFIQKAVREAAQQLLDARVKEGMRLQTDLLGKLCCISDLVAYIEKKSPQIIEEYTNRLKEKVEEFLSESVIDENRILAEVTVFADKCCVDEELVRLKSHIHTAGEILKTGGSVGRNLDFIIQEMNREANTILSKSNDIDISNQGIVLKTEIEKVREQIQNIE